MVSMFIIKRSIYLEISREEFFSYFEGIVLCIFHFLSYEQDMGILLFSIFLQLSVKYDTVGSVAGRCGGPVWQSPYQIV